MPEIYCLMVAGMSLDDSLRELLFVTACKMAKGGNVRKVLRGDGMEGMITTEYKPAQIAGVSGVMFSAEIETEEQKGKVRFFVRPIDISTYNEKEFVWIQGTPM